MKREAIIRGSLVAIALTLSQSCSQTPQQINFDVDTGSYANIVEVLRAVAGKHKLRFKEEEFQYGNSRSNISAYMLYNRIETVMVQNKLIDCKTKEQTFTPCFSNSTYSISIYKSSFFKPTEPLGCLAADIASEIRDHGGAIIGPIETSSGASLSCKR